MVRILGLTVGVAVFSVVMTSSAAAQRNAPSSIVAPAETKESCVSITPKQQLVLERRALGGDLQAQYVIASCAWFRNVADVVLTQTIEDESEAEEGETVIVKLNLFNNVADAESDLSTATNISVVDTLPRGLEIFDSSGEIENIYVWKPDDLKPGASAESEYTATVVDLKAFKAWRAERDARSVAKRAQGSAEVSYHYSRADKVLYTYLWATLAFCDRQFNDLEEATRTLENQDRIYKRKRPARDLGQEERRQREQEVARLNQIRREANDALYLLEGDPISSTSKAFVEMMEGLGAGGLVSLAYMRECPAYPGFQQRHVRAAIWRRALEDVENTFQIGRDENGDRQAIRNRVALINNGLSSEDNKSVDAVSYQYKLYDDASRIADLETRSTLGRMGELPVQYLQLALGAFRAHPGFKNGINLGGQFSIDNVYGERTSKLVKEAQKNFCVIRDVAASEDALRDVTDPENNPEGESVQALPNFHPADDCVEPNSPRTKAEQERRRKASDGVSEDYPTGWLTALQSRALICRAATNRQDPYSYMHLAQMFANGYGYSDDFDKAIFAVKRAQRVFNAGPSQQPSNFKDLEGNKITRNYRETAAQLERDVYRRAAEIILGRSIDPGIGVDQSTRARIDARIASANYDAPGNLCSDQVWKSTVEPGKYALAEKPRSKFAASRLSVAPETEFGIATNQEFIEGPSAPSLPLSVVSDQSSSVLLGVNENSNSVKQ